jgi:hypothetical protein
MKLIVQAAMALAALGVAVQAQPVKVGEPAKSQSVVKLSKAELASITAGSSANFPPGQFPAGNPAKAPGNSNPNEKGGKK